MNRPHQQGGRHSEGAPIPVARDAVGHLRGLGQAEGSFGHGHDWRRRCGILGVRRRGARSLAVVASVPRLVLVEAVVAGARGSGAWVEVGVLVQRHLEAGVLVAENVAAAAAVMTADKVVEGALAGRVVADGSIRVGLRCEVSTLRCTITGRCHIKSSHAAEVQEPINTQRPGLT